MSRPRLIDAAWRARALEALRACCAARGRAVTKEEFTVWGRGRLPRFHPESMIRQGSGWLAWLLKAGYAPSAAQRTAARQTIPGSSARETRRRRQGYSSRPCQNAPECLRHPRKGNRFCDACHAGWGHVAQDVGVAGIG